MLQEKVQAPRQLCVMQVVLSLAPGGTERLAIQLVNGLSDGFRMVVICLDESGDWASEVIDRGVRVVPLHRAPGFHPSLGVRIAKLAARYDAAVVHCHHYSPFVYGCIASLVNRRFGFVFTEHGRLSDAPPKLKRRAANLVLSRLPQSVFAVSASLKQHMVAEGFPDDRVGVIYNGVDPGPPPTPAARLEARRLLGIGEEPFLIGTAARLDTVKDLPTLINAVALLRLRVPAAHLVIVGDGDERSALESEIRRLQLEDRVTLTGYRADVRLLFSAFDVYVNSSISEGVSLTILEAMAAALPVVATAVGGTPEVVVQDVTGLLVPARSPEATADAIARIATLPDTGRALGAAGRVRVETLFTIDRMVGDYAREYARVARRDP
jgi:glycosyltransferase involved in cell wall biosynthesis